MASSPVPNGCPRKFSLPYPWTELEGAPLTNTAPAVTLVGEHHTYLFVIIREMRSGQLYLNQGTIGGSFVGWNVMP